MTLFLLPRQLVLYSYSSFNFVTFFEASMSTIKIVVVVVVAVALPINKIGGNQELCQIDEIWFD